MTPPESYTQDLMLTQLRAVEQQLDVIATRLEEGHRRQREVIAGPPPWNACLHLLDWLAFAASGGRRLTRASKRMGFTRLVQVIFCDAPSVPISISRIRSVAKLHTMQKSSGLINFASLATASVSTPTSITAGAF